MKKAIGHLLLLSPCVPFIVLGGILAGWGIIAAIAATILAVTCGVMLGITLIDDRDPEDSDYGLVRLIAVPIATVRWYRAFRAAECEETAGWPRRRCLKTAIRNALENVL